MGIGTTSPAVPFHVAKTANLEMRFDSDGTRNIVFADMNGTYDAQIEVNAAGKLWLTTRQAQGIEFGINNSPKMSIDSSGKILISTSTPSGYADRQLTVGDTSIASSNIEVRAATNGWCGIAFSDSAVADANSYRGSIEYSHSTNHMQFRTDAVERMRILSDGKVIVGDGTNWTAYVSDANLQITDDLNAKLVLSNPGNATWAFAVGTNASLYINDESQSTVPMVINSSGNVGMGTTDPLYALHLSNAMGSTPSFIHMQVTGNNTVGGGGGIAFDTSCSSSSSSRKSSARDSPFSSSTCLARRTTSLGSRFIHCWPPSCSGLVVLCLRFLLPRPF